MTTTEVDDTAIDIRALQATRLFAVRDQFHPADVEWKTIQQALADLWTALPTGSHDRFLLALDHWAAADRRTGVKTGAKR